MTSHHQKGAAHYVHELDIAHGKDGVEMVEYLPDLEEVATHIDANAVELSAGHRQYLIQRHGTIELDPMPAWGDADPLNWPLWKKVSNLCLVAFSAMLSTFNAAAVMPAFVTIAEDLNVSVPTAAYLTSIQIAVLGVAPLFWRPLSNRYGRRPIWLISAICSMICNIGCYLAPNYGSMMACRALVSFFICPASAIGSAIVTETFFKSERGRYMGIWTLFVTMGVPGGAFCFGFVAEHLGYRWIYKILAVINASQFVAFLFLCPESRYLRKAVEHEGSDFKQEYMTLRRIDPTPLTAYDFVHPLTLFRHASVMIPAAAYAMTFLVGSVLIGIEIPQLYAEKFKLNAQQNGLQFISVIVGTIIGEQLVGAMSDRWMSRRTRAIGWRPRPEYRLWLSYIGYTLTIIGAIVFFICLAQTGESYSIVPTIGAGIGSAGVQAVTTVLITYAVDTHPEEAASIGVFVTFIRQIWGFIGPFWFPYMLADIALTGSAGVAAALVVTGSVVPTIFLQLRRAPHKHAE